MPIDDIDRGDEPRPLTGLDALFANTNIILLVIFAFCCNIIALILGVIGLVSCKDPKAKQNAMIVTIIAAIMFALGVIARLSGIGTTGGNP